VEAAHLVRRATDRAPEQEADALLQHPVGGQPDRVLDAPSFEELVQLWPGEGGIRAEVQALHLASVARHHRLQHRAPAVGGVHVARPQRAALQVAELVEHEERVVAGAAEVAVVGAALLLAVGRALAGVHVEHHDPRRTAAMHGVDPAPGQVGERGQVPRPGQPFRLEAAHLAGGGRGLPDGPVAHHPAHRGVAPQPLGVVHVLVAGEAAEHGLPQQADQGVPAVLAGARVRQCRARGGGQAKRVVELAVGQQSQHRK
jgi:hypothetical protein